LLTGIYNLIMTKLNIFNDYHLLEDRITHGFIATLNSLRPKMARNLLNKLFDQENKGIKLSASNLIFDIQSPSAVHRDKFSAAEQSVLLKITQTDTKLKENEDSRQEKSRADGWIFDGKTVFLVESKLGRGAKPRR